MCAKALSRWSSVLATLVFASPSLAQTGPDAFGGRLAVSVTAGTRGMGAELLYAASNRIVWRGAVDALETRSSGRYRGFDYRVTGEGRSVGGFVDFHPAKDPWLVSAGLYLGEPDVDLKARPRRAVRVGGAVFSPAQIGELGGGIDVDAASPFVGIGYDNTFVGDRRWGTRALLGAALTGAPSVRLASRDGTLSNSRAFQARLAAETQDLEAEIEDYSIYPVVQLGLTYRF